MKNIRDRLLLAFEYKKLEREIARTAAPDASPIAFRYPKKEPMWAISLADKKSVYMSLPAYVSANHYVVHVYANKLYRAWLKSGRNHYQTCPLRQNMINDYKYTEAEVGFSYGLDNPVPLAEIAPSQRNGQLCVGWVNGITRTLWLLHNLSRSFPVLCYTLEEAQILSQYAGIGIPIKVSDLLVDEEPDTPYI